MFAEITFEFLFQNAALHCPACSSLRWLFNTPCQLDGAEDTYGVRFIQRSVGVVQYYMLWASDSSLRAHQNQFCTALFSYTSSIQNCDFWRDGIICSASSWNRKPATCSLPAAHQRTLTWWKSVNTNLTQASALLTDSIDIWRCHSETHNFPL